MGKLKSGKKRHGNDGSKPEKQRTKRSFHELVAAFAGRLLDKKIVVLCVVAVLLLLSCVGVFLVKKNGDVTSYLDDDTNTMIGKKVLEEAYNIQGDLNIAVSYLSKKQVETIYNAIISDKEINSMYTNPKTGKKQSILSNSVWIGKFDMLYSDMAELDRETADKMYAGAEKNYVRTTVMGDNSTVTTYILSFYFRTPSSDNITISALNIIEEVIKDNINQLKSADLINPTLSSEDCYYFGGQCENARALVDSSVNDMPIFVAIAVIAVFIILLFTTHSYFEPIIFLATLGISILLNMGSNIIAGIPIGTISTITSSCSTILQLALAMDYAIFLMHTYYEELKVKLNPRDAIIAALPKTLASISASALTTIGGFVALFFMQFGMGYDLGFVLAKGVLLSLLTVIILQPILIFLFNKPIMKTQHPWIVEPHMGFVSKNITKKPVAITVIALCLAVCLPCAYFQAKAPLNYISLTAPISTEEMSVPEYVVSTNSNQLIFLVPFGPAQGDSDDTIDYVAKQYEFIDYLKTIGVNDDSINQVNDIFSLCTIIPSYTDYKELETHNTLVLSFISGNFVKTYEGRSMMLYTVNLSGHSEDVETYAALNAIRSKAAEIFNVAETEIYVTGLAQGAYDLASVTPGDFMLVNMLSAVIIFIILLATFRSFLLSVILLMVIEAGIFFNLALVYFTSLIAVTYPAISTVFVSEINFMSYIIVSAIELGATVDYAILLTSKYKEERAKGADPDKAIRNGIYRAAPGVTTSAAILIAVCLAVHFVTSNAIVGQITELIARGTFFSYVLTFTLLPAILSLKERAHAAIIKRKGRTEEFDETVPDLNAIAHAKRKERRLALAAAKAEEFGFVNVPREPRRKSRKGKKAAEDNAIMTDEILPGTEMPDADVQDSVAHAEDDPADEVTTTIADSSDTDVSAETENPVITDVPVISAEDKSEDIAAGDVQENPSPAKKKRSRKKQQ